LVWRRKGGITQPGREVERRGNCGKHEVLESGARGYGWDVVEPFAHLVEKNSEIGNQT
jgi:hypothetical protein